MRRCEHECVCWGMVEYGDAECPGPCDAYAPMVDVDALLKLADELDTCTVDRLNHLGEADRISGREYARRIREALGVSK